MKHFWVVAFFALIFASCTSSENKNEIGPVDIFSFDIPSGISGDSLNAAITNAFLKRYALLDTSVIATGKIAPANIIGYDSAAQTTKCVSGYYIVVHEEPKPDPTFEGDFYGSPSKIYFFTGSGSHFEILNKPVVTPGSSEDSQEEIAITLKYFANSQCSLLDVTLSSPVQTAGVMTNDHITFYYWDELTHRLKAAAAFETAFSSMNTLGATRKGEISFQQKANAFFDLEYKASGDSTFTAYYIWENGAYQKQNRGDDQSDYVLMADSIEGGEHYPLFRSTKNPRAAEAVNKSLQLEDFDELITDENRTRFFPENDTVDRQFLIKRINDNMLLVSTTVSFGEGDNFVREYRQRYYNARTGDEIRFEDMITKDSIPGFAKKVTRALVGAMQKGGGRGSKCVLYLRDAWKDERVLIGLRMSIQSITFETPKCNPQPEKSAPAYDLWRSEQPLYSFDTYLSEYFFRLVREEVVDPAGDDPLTRTWHGTLDDETKVTFILRPPGVESLSYDGYVVFDDIGKRSYFTSSGPGDSELTINVKDEEAVEVVGTFRATLQDETLVGTYTTKDGSVRQFKAVTGKESDE